MHNSITEKGLEEHLAAAENLGDRAEIKVVRTKLRTEKAEKKKAKQIYSLQYQKAVFAQKLHEYMEANPDRLIPVYEIPDTPNFQPPSEIKLGRTGIDGDLELLHSEDEVSNFLNEFCKENLPRVIVVRPTDHVMDTVSQDEIEDEKHAFMRGIFYYVGIEREKWKRIFVQNDVTTYQRQNASKKLNSTLKKAGPK